MNFGLNVSYLGLFVLKKIGNQHQIYFFIVVRYCIEPCNDRSEIIIVKDNKKLQEMGRLLAYVGNAAYSSGARCLPRLGTIRAKNVSKMFHGMKR